MRLLWGGASHTSGSAVASVAVPASVGQSPAAGVSVWAGLRRRLHRWAQSVVVRLEGLKLVVDIDDGVARVLVIAGRQVRSWGTIALDDSAAEGSQAVAAAQGNANDLRNLLRTLAPFGARTVTSLPLYASLFRRIPLPKMGARYMEAVITSEMVESIPFTADQVDMVWQFRRQKGSTEVLAVATPKEAMDRRVLLLKGTGHRPAAAYPRAVALTFSTPISDGLIVELGRSSTSVVRVTRGFPEAVHTLDTSGFGADAEARVQAIAQAIEQLACSSGPESESAEDRSAPVLFIGPLAKNRPLVEALTSVVGRPVQTFVSPLAFPDHFPAHEYAASLGLALADRARLKPGKVMNGQRRPSVNLLPERHVPRPIPVQATATFGLLFAMSYLAFSMSRVVDMEKSRAGEILSQATTVEQEVRSRQVTKGIVDAVAKKKEAAEQVRTVLRSHLARWDEELSTQQRRLELVTRELLPRRVSLATVAQQGDTFTLSGVADSPELVLQYAASIRSADVFTSVRVVKMDGAASNPLAGPEGSLPLVAFQIKAVQPSAGASVEPGGPSLSSPLGPAKGNGTLR